MVTELGIGQPPGSSHVFNERRQLPAKADFKLLSFLSVGTKQQSRLKYSHRLMSISLWWSSATTLNRGTRILASHQWICMLSQTHMRKRVYRHCYVLVPRLCGPEAGHRQRTNEINEEFLQDSCHLNRFICDLAPSSRTLAAGRVGT